MNQEGGRSSHPERLSRDRERPKGARRLPMLFGALFGGAHLVLVLALAGFIFVLSLRPVAQWQMTWLYLEAVDWPVSQLLWWDGWPRGPYEDLPYQLQDPFWYLVPLFVFGVLGSTWYAALGGAIGYWAEQVRILRSTPR